MSHSCADDSLCVVEWMRNKEGELTNLCQKLIKIKVISSYSTLIFICICFCIYFLNYNQMYECFF